MGVSYLDVGKDSEAYGLGLMLRKTRIGIESTLNYSIPLFRKRYIGSEMRHLIPLVTVCGLILFMNSLNSYPYLAQLFSAAGQVYFNFDGNSSEVNYREYENTTAGIRIKYPSNWNTLENLGNVSGNNIIADFYLTGF